MRHNFGLAGGEPIFEHDAVEGADEGRSKVKAKGGLTAAIRGPALPASETKTKPQPEGGKNRGGFLTRLFARVFRQSCPAIHVQIMRATATPAASAIIDPITDTRI